VAQRPAASGPPVDVVVVGGGVIGLSTAWRAAQGGMRVRLFDPTPGRGASWAAAGMLAPVNEASYGEEALVALLVAAADRWAGFADELTETTGHDIDYRRSGTVTVGLDASDRAAIDELAQFRRSIGLDARTLSSSASRQLVPQLSPSVRGGAEVPADHQVDNRRLVGALLAACGAAGVDLDSRSVDAVALRDGRATGVVVDGDETSAGAVVLCTGWQAGSMAGVPDGVLPAVRPVKGHVLRLRDRIEHPLLDRTVRGLVHGESCYLVPRRDGSLVIGATVEEQGSDRRIQAGAVYALLERARALVPGIDELELDECVTGLRPGSPDNAPYIGWTAISGLAVAAGHYRNGILLTPITAEAVAELLIKGSVPGPVEPFEPQRLPHSPGG
jgi:glycine oxidase